MISIIECFYYCTLFSLPLTLRKIFLFRRHLVNERNREELDEVSNRRLTSMALDVARGLSYLAELKYVHRDVACRNCLVNSSRVVKLADFGMTRPMYENDYYRFSRKGWLFTILLVGQYLLIFIRATNMIAQNIDD